VITRIILQFAAKWEVLTILALFLFLPLLRISLFSFSWKGSLLFLKNLNLPRKITRISVIVTTLFFLLLVINFGGLVPFSFARRRQGWFRIVFRLSLFCVSLVLFFSRGKISFIVHLVPTGSPVGLGLVLFWMEIISTVIRPLTLVLRLCANITAGHVMLGLISRFFVQSVFSPSIISVVLYLCGLVFFLFEGFVAFIQRLVFSLLLINYLDKAA